MQNGKSLFERGAAAVAGAARHYRLPLIASLVFGLTAHMFAFSNKLLNADETAALFSKGATLTSGRWGLEATSFIFPNVSMPWIYGLISLVLMAAAVCFLISCFDIEKGLTQILLSGAVLAFPALTGNFCYMFTSASYALAVLLAVAAVWLFRRGGVGRAAAGCALLSFSLGIYQAYIGVAASLCVLILIKRLMDADSAARDVLKSGLRLLLLLLLSLAVYYLVTLAVEHFNGSEYQEYEVTAERSILKSVLTAYSAFVNIFFSGYFGYVNSKLSMAAHFVCAAVILFALISNQIRAKAPAKAALMLVLLLVYPLSVNCIYLAASVDIIHSLVLFGFVSFYVLAAFAAESLPLSARPVRSLAALAAAIIIACNVYFANKVYLKMYLEYENAYSFYTTLMAQIMDTPGFSEYTIIDLVGSTESGLTSFDERIDTSGFTGPNEDLVNTYTRVSFIKYYLGLDLYMYREDTIYNATWFDEMPCYPEEGSIVYREEPDQNRIIVKLG